MAIGACEHHDGGDGGRRAEDRPPQRLDRDDPGARVRRRLARFPERPEVDRQAADRARH